MKVVIYTYPPDYVAASYAARGWIALGVQVVLAIDRRSPALRLPGVEVIRTNFERAGNLNGMQFVRGHLRLLRSIADGDRYILKADSDAMAFGLNWLHTRDETAVGMCSPGHRGFYGLCYGLRVYKLDEMIEAADARVNDSTAAEDLAMASLAAEVGSVHAYEHLEPGCPIGAYSWSSKETVEQWKARYEVLCFQRTGGRTHRGVAEKMKEFLSL